MSDERPPHAAAGAGCRGPRRVLIGVGHRDRGDDAVGPVVADAVLGMTDAVTTLVREGDLAVLPLLWDRDDDVLIVDACRADGAVGTVRQVAPDELQRSVALSSHGLDVADAIHLAERLDRMPRRLRVLGVTGRRFEHGPMSPELRAALPTVIASVATWLGIGPDPTDPTEPAADPAPHDTG
ncbi:MAG: hydrogenase maturation protease [Actinomycetota bacterium]